MGCSKGLMVALAVGRSFGAEEGKAQAAAGKVVGVTEGSRTIVVESKLSGQPWIIGAQVTDQTQFGVKSLSQNLCRARGGLVPAPARRREHRGQTIKRAGAPARGGGP